MLPLSLLHNVTTQVITLLEVNFFLKTEGSLSAGRVKFDALYPQCQIMQLDHRRCSVQFVE